MTRVCKICDLHPALAGGETCLACWRCWFHTTTNAIAATKSILATAAAVHNLDVADLQPPPAAAVERPYKAPANKVDAGSWSDLEREVWSDLKKPEPEPACPPPAPAPDLVPAMVDLVDEAIRALGAASEPTAPAGAAPDAEPTTVASSASEPPHGSARRYWRGCRCDVCRRAIAEYSKERNASKRTAIPIVRYVAAPANDAPVDVDVDDDDDSPAIVSSLHREQPAFRTAKLREPINGAELAAAKRRLAIREAAEKRLELEQLERRSGMSTRRPPSTKRAFGLPPLEKPESDSESDEPTTKVAGVLPPVSTSFKF